MKTASLEKSFITPSAGVDELRRHAHTASLTELRKTLYQAEFNVVYDFFRSIAVDRASRGEFAAAIEILREADAIALENSEGRDERYINDIHTALLELITALQLEADLSEEAATTAAAALTQLAQEPKRKDEPFLAVLGALLTDVALLHSSRGEYKQAERELEKALKVFERLARINPDRYGPAHILAQTAASSIYRSRLRQANLLAHYQVATTTYLEQVNAGIEDATVHLIESLHTEGRTLAQMGRHREAIQYLSRALKYHTRIAPEMDLAQLAMSIDLGESLLNVKATRDKGIHLLNTLLHKATKLGAETEHRRIVEILFNAKSRKLDILGIWHKVFPK